MTAQSEPSVLRIEQRKAFEADGVVRLTNVVPLDAVCAMRDFLWDTTLAGGGLVRDDQTSWSPGGGLGLVDVNGALRPGPDVHRLLVDAGQSAVFAALEIALGQAVDQVFGAGHWVPVAGSRGGQAVPNFPISNARWNVPHDAWHADEPTAASRTVAWGLLAFAFLDEVEHRGGATLAIAGSPRRLHELAIEISRPEQSYVAMYNAAIEAARQANVELDALLHPALTCVLTHEQSTEAFAQHEPWIADLFTPGGDPDERVSRFMSAGCVSMGIPLRVVELTGAPGDITLMDPRCLHTVSANITNRARLVMKLGCVGRPPSSRG